MFNKLTFALDLTPAAFLPLQVSAEQIGQACADLVNPGETIRRQLENVRWPTGPARVPSARQPGRK